VQLTNKEWVYKIDDFARWNDEDLSKIIEWDTDGISVSPSYKLEAVLSPMDGEKRPESERSELCRRPQEDNSASLPPKDNDQP
jgi:hypothetical protein